MKPKIAVLMDENTNDGGNQYAMGKGYFRAIVDAGGLPMGMPYERDVLDEIISMSDGLLCPGGRFAYPDAFYVGDLKSHSPVSDRLAIETKLINRFLAEDKPVLGICAGMQLLGCLHGAKMTPDLRTTIDGAGPHDEAGRTHKVAVEANTMLHNIVGVDEMEVNTFHREALVELSEQIVMCAKSPDGIIEAIELPAFRFALGIQWHPERLADTDHPGDQIFSAFVDICR
ncbi:gamma-glutamyl-gamma-aminobutyrate hydrolase family protein [Maritalea sp.]|uniref:gamma-glutamyl-gamma-aminobutyrate hydrolase family protein n=1 Tax=Maritalea sp. TaxID=2003361 RepID=UPI003EFB11A9